MLYRTGTGTQSEYTCVVILSNAIVVVSKHLP